MITLIAEDFIHPESIEIVKPIYTKLIDETRKESGCISYHLHQDLKQPGHFVFIEKWQDEQAIQDHVDSPHFKQLVPLIDKHIFQEAKYMRLSDF
ncbi:MAG: putative quinol monooxygenase [Vagococcus sp.]|uniref:putative quinol monooxygenase n=1 Tax=Vagococcus sp. TaxID=1933889 RepID=UPI002FC84A11